MLEQHKDPIVTRVKRISEFDNTALANAEIQSGGILLAVTAGTRKISEGEFEAYPLYIIGSLET